MKTRGHKLVYQCACLAVFALGILAMAAQASSAPQDKAPPELLTTAPTLTAPSSLITPAAPASRENCGTVLTGLIDDPDSDVNPCPRGCERGEQLWVKTYKSGDSTQYEASYQCYMPAIPTLAMPADAPSSGENCGTYWTGWMETLDAAVNPCPQGCLRGQKPTVKTGLSGHGIKYDVNYQCYMPETPTLAMPADAPSSGENCGTYWTGWMDTLDAGVNPCPQGCVRGQQPTVKTGLSDHGIKYDVNYQCYTATTAMAPHARAPKSIGDLAAAPPLVSSTPAGKLIPASGPWGEFVRVEGAQFGSAKTVRGMWIPNDDTTQPPSMTQTVTLRAHDGADAIEIQIPDDPLTSGWSGDFTKGALRLLLIMPDESVVYAGEYVIDAPSPAAALPNGLAGQRGGVASRPIDTSALSQTGPRRFVLAGFSASGTSVTTPPHNYALEGFSGSGTSVTTPPHTYVLVGFSSAGTSVTTPPHTYALTGFIASGASVTMPPHTYVLSGFSASGTSVTTPPHTYTLPGFTLHGTSETAPADPTRRKQ